MAAGGQDDDHRPDSLALAADGVHQLPEFAKIHLRRFARQPVRHPHSRPWLFPESSLAHVAAQRGVRDRDALASEQLVDAGEL